MNSLPFPPPTVPGPSPEPRRRRSIGARIALALLVSSAVRGVASLMLDSDSTSAGPPAVGTCFNGTSAKHSVTDCGSPHDGEIFAQVQHPAAAGEAIPIGGDMVTEEVCLSAFHDNLGASLSRTDLSLTMFLPPIDSWTTGERTVACALTREEHQLIGRYRPDPSSASVVPEKVVGALATGDCLALRIPVEGSLMSVVQTPPCTTTHNFEVFAVVRLESLDYPTNLDSVAEQQCRSHFEAYVGVDFDHSDLSATSLSPTRESWAAGDRQLVCLLARQGWAALTESMKGAHH